ncbi:hypothetical protein AAFF_G00102020 [Aldrovandia affinis]|uniref:Uncharacterized protein n=1 Tax=Aldrovandia affinis TaxID=143900 RepID=A0AAD7WB34_9TELE|nr:hypothetical protein AAFF_G00102020 [Aldrovandia affinis]
MHDSNPQFLRCCSSRDQNGTWASTTRQQPESQDLLSADAAAHLLFTVAGEADTFQLLLSDENLALLTGSVRLPLNPVRQLQCSSGFSPQCILAIKRPAASTADH